jgi:hypothetical protein
MAETFFIEPWQVEETPDALTMREEVTSREVFFGGGVALGISLMIAVVDYWLWRRGTIEGFFAAGLGFVSVLLAAKACEQFLHGWRLCSHGPRCLTFRRGDYTVKLNGFRDLTNGRVERIEIIAKTVWTRDAPRQLHEYPHQRHREYTVQLFVDGQRMELGTYGAEAAADRLAETIARWVGIRTSRLSEDR